MRINQIHSMREKARTWEEGGREREGLRGRPGQILWNCGEVFGSYFLGGEVWLANSTCLLCNEINFN